MILFTVVLNDTNAMILKILLTKISDYIIYKYYLCNLQLITYYTKLKNGMNLIKMI